jgi:hypothetical protein
MLCGQGSITPKGHQSATLKIDGCLGRVLIGDQLLHP